MNSHINNTRRVVSGIQPSGILHLGNYFGAVKNYVKLQNDPSKQCFFFIADNHSSTVRFNTDSDRDRDINSYTNSNTPTLSDLKIKTAACLLASGVNPKQAVLFNQSDVPAHSELMWILSCISPLSWLNKMIQFKEKSKRNTNLASIGLYTYPILMAADILIYKADEVPVGDDQIQHIELTRDIATRLNKIIGKEILPMPEYILNKDSSRIMSLQNGKTKMSKSDRNSHSCISLITSEDDIKKKIMKAKTDSNGSIGYNINERPEVSNLVRIYSQCNNISIDETVEKFSNANTHEFKLELIKSLNERVLPISYKAKSMIEKEFDYVRDVLEEGRKVAMVEANRTLEEVKANLNNL